MSDNPASFRTGQGPPPEMTRIDSSRDDPLGKPGGALFGYVAWVVIRVRGVCWACAEIIRGAVRSGDCRRSS